MAAAQDRAAEMLDDPTAEVDPRFWTKVMTSDWLRGIVKDVFGEACGKRRFIGLVGAQASG
jgi:hypothetical protein